MASTSEILGRVPLFALLDDSERAALAERIEHKSAKKGEPIFEQGHPGDALFIVLSGVVEIWIKKQTGEKVVLETAREGEFFGEISLLDGGPRTASATATEDAELIEVDRGDLDELVRLKPASAMDLLAATGRRLRETNRLLRQSAAKDINEETEAKSSVVEQAADWVTEFSGSIPFLAIHIVLFTVWIVLNLEAFSDLPVGGFDPFPYGLLTMCVSLEAIILSVLVMLSQNRQVARDRIRNDIEYQVNISAEAKVAHLHEKLDRMQEDVLSKFRALEKAGTASKAVETGGPGLATAGKAAPDAPAAAAKPSGAALAAASPERAPAPAAPVELPIPNEPATSAAAKAEGGTGEGRGDGH